MVFCRCLQRILARSERMVAASTPEDAQEIAALDASFTQKQQSMSMVPRKEPSPALAQPQTTSTAVDLTKVCFIFTSTKHQANQTNNILNVVHCNYHTQERDK